MLKLRYKYNVLQDRKKKEEKQKRKEEEGEKEMTQEQLEKLVDRELEQTLKKVEQQRELKKQREREAKQDVRTKMSVIASSTINQDDELMLDKKTWDRLKEIDIEDLKYAPQDGSDEENMDANERKYRFLTDGAAEEDEGESGEEESDDEVRRVDKMNNEMEASIRQQKDYQMLKDKRTIKKELKAKALLDMQRKRRMDESDEEKLANEDLIGNQEQESENDDDLDEQRQFKRIFKEQLEARKKQKQEKED
jgi:hypothetical protein